MKLADRQVRTGAEAVVAFDFDGTLTCRDSFVDFLVWRAGPARLAIAVATLAPAAMAYAIDHDRGALKAKALRRVLGSPTREGIEAAAERYAAARFDALMRPDALARWRDWGERGARRYIVTASPLEIVAPFARRLGAEGLIATRLAFDAEGRFAGRLEGANCRGPEKVARLRQALGEGLRLAAAYGDTDGDAEMLAIAEEAGFRTFTGRP